MSAATGQPTSLELLDRAFQELVTGPQPLALDGSGYAGGLPQRRIVLDELRVLLLRPSTSCATRDAVWRELVRRARTGDERWLIGAAGVLMPGLCRMARRLARTWRGIDAVEVDAEIVVAFLEALHSLDASRGGIAGRLCWEAFRGAERGCRSDREARCWCIPWPEIAAPGGGAPGHPDLVLRSAVRTGVVTEDEADLVGSTRLEAVRIRELAARTGARPSTLHQRRWRAERRLVSWLLGSDLSILGTKAGVRMWVRARRVSVGRPGHRPLRLALLASTIATRAARCA